MSADYSFERRSIILLIVGTLLLFFLFFFLGVLAGLSMERSRDDSKSKVKVVQSSETDKSDDEAVNVTNDQSKSKALAKETEVKPVSPEFKEISPEAEKPAISKPKIE